MIISKLGKGFNFYLVDDFIKSLCNIEIKCWNVRFNSIICIRGRAYLVKVYA